MLIFKDEKTVTGMLKKSLFGEFRSLYNIEDYGFCFSIVRGRYSLGYACFYETAYGNIECAVEFSSYESMVFGETFDIKTASTKRNEFIAFCHENGINADISDHFLTLLEMTALGEKVSFPALSGSKVSEELLSEILVCRAMVLGGDEPGALSKAIEIHFELKEINKIYPFGYSNREFMDVWNVNMKKQKRIKAMCKYLDYLGKCATAMRRKIELETLIEIATLNKIEYENT